jgi:hypothetical protein
MMLDPKLLEQAQAAGTRLANAERDALLARADYHTAIRRLHLGGAPLREIAQALSLSHQRVQQVVSAAGGSWWQVWRRRGAAADAVCSWCGRPPSEVAKLIAGPKIYICDACVESAEGVFTGHGDLKRVSRSAHRCAFCRKRANRERPIVTGPLSVCRECLRVCREILESRG